MKKTVLIIGAILLCCGVLGRIIIGVSVNLTPAPTPSFTRVEG
jgi:hypothetical protein